MKLLREILKQYEKRQFLKLKNSLLELEKRFYRTGSLLKDREVKIETEIEKLFFTPIVVSIDGMVKFKEKQMKKIRPIKNTWYDWLINYIPAYNKYGRWF